MDLDTGNVSREEVGKTPDQLRSSLDIDARAEGVRAMRNQESYKRFLESVPDTVIRANPEDLKKVLDAVDVEFKQDPELAKTFEAIFLQHDQRALQEHSKQRLESIQKMWDWSVRLLDVDEGNVSKFQLFVDQMRVVRADRNAATIDVYRSPRDVGRAASFGPQDVVVQADRYVYASLDGIKHFMARSKDADVLDADAFEDRAELVMQDVANVKARHPDHLAKTYLENVFDLKTGKEILARYLALVFKSPEEAQRFFANNTNPSQAQRWDQEGMVNLSMEEIDFSKVQDNDSARGQIEQSTNIAQERTKEIVAMMKKIAAETGIEPPLSLEVRIPDSAEKKK